MVITETSGQYVISEKSWESLLKVYEGPWNYTKPRKKVLWGVVGNVIVGSEERSDEVGGGRCKIYVCKILPSIIPPSTHPASLPHHYPSRLLCPTAFIEFQAVNKLISSDIVSEIIEAA